MMDLYYAALGGSSGGGATTYIQVTMATRSESVGYQVFVDATADFAVAQNTTVNFTLQTNRHSYNSSFIISNGGTFITKKIPYYGDYSDETATGITGVYFTPATDGSGKVFQKI